MERVEPFVLPENLDDRDNRLSSGHSVKDVVKKASYWWDQTGCKIVSHKDFKNPDLGFCSGITRGLRWDFLNEREKKKIVSMYHHYHFLKDNDERN